MTQLSDYTNGTAERNRHSNGNLHEGMKNGVNHNRYNGTSATDDGRPFSPLSYDFRPNALKCVLCLEFMYDNVCVPIYLLCFVLKIIIIVKLYRRRKDSEANFLRDAYQGLGSPTELQDSSNHNGYPRSQVTILGEFLKEILPTLVPSKSTSVSYLV